MIKSYNIPTEYVAELVEVFSDGYEEEIDGKPNPQTKQQYASAKFDTEVINYVKRRVQDYRKAQLLKSINSDTIIEVPQ
jgi:hypothetical protein